MINYSKTIVFYNIYLTLMIPYAIVAATATRLGLTAQQVADLTAFQTAWNAAYLAYLAPGTYGRLTIAQINLLYRTYKAYCDELKKQLKNNPSLTLTEMDYIIFDIHKNSTRRGIIPEPTAEPAVILKASNHLNNEYVVTDLANPRSGAKPPDVKRVKVFMPVLPDTTARPTIDMLRLEMESGTMTFDIPFTEDQVRHIAYVAVCFSNDSGDGPTSAIIASPII